VRRAVLGSLAALLAIGLAGCSASARPALGESNPWIGKTRRELIQQLGPPTQVIPLDQIGGKMMIYTEPDRPHYIFEIGPNDKVYRATETK
jgi:hypothetical protein